MNLCVQKIPNHIVLMQLLHFSHTFKWVFLWSLIRFNIVYYRKNLINPLLLKHKKLLKKSRVRETARMNVFSYFCDASCSVIAAKVTLHECVIWWMFWVGGTFVIKPVFLTSFLIWLKEITSKWKSHIKPDKIFMHPHQIHISSLHNSCHILHDAKSRGIATTNNENYHWSNFLILFDI